MIRNNTKKVDICICVLPHLIIYTKYRLLEREKIYMKRLEKSATFFGVNHQARVKNGVIDEIQERNK